ncbi:hypothetical protein BDP27DRAFT_1424461 [Rhodocollybia butyracea]|uniref:Uncharacterized protein n=1 Tax=Rhodocollybia butyracea TaxID=206335 RepID=A0A9P5PPN4_9AGAR|nr:hypothetical protein BDP27DRAFT_1424461 [Rhodocollybia butyracea]
MSSSNTNLLSDTKVAAPADNAENNVANLQHVATLVKALKAGTQLDKSNDAIRKAVMENAHSRDAFMKAVMSDKTLAKLCANVVEITSDHVEAATDEPSRLERHLTPPLGTRGFIHLRQTLNHAGHTWTVDVYAYRHAESEEVTVVIVHSGITHNEVFFEMNFGNSPEGIHNPVTYDSEVGNGNYSYHIEYVDNINMIGPDGRNPIVFRAIYKDTFIGQEMGRRYDVPSMRFSQLAGPIHGLTLYNASFRVGTSVDLWLTMITAPFNLGYFITLTV